MRQRSPSPTSLTAPGGLRSEMPFSYIISLLDDRSIRSILQRLAFLPTYREAEAAGELFQVFRQFWQLQGLLIRIYLEGAGASFSADVRRTGRVQEVPG